MPEKPFIIIAEDDKFLASIYKTRLAEEKWDVLVVENGEEALEAVRARRPNVLLLDIIMPVKDGFEVLTEIKKDKALKGIKIIVLTNLGQEEDKRRALEMGARAFVTKAQTSLSEMMEKIKQTMA